MRFRNYVVEVKVEALKAILDNFCDRFDGLVKRDEPLAPYSTFQTGGPADLFVDADNSDILGRAIKLASELNLTCFVIGQGSNLLISDLGFRGLIIRNHILGHEVKDNEIYCGAGELLDNIVDLATENSLTGLEFAAGIWGTMGGAVYGNAGAYGSQISSVLKEAELIDTNGNIRLEKGEYFQFTYRHSYLKTTGEIVTGMTISLNPGEQGKIRARVDDIRDERGFKHPVQPCSAGCFFKNVEDPSQPHGKLAAGKLLEEIGAKEIVLGGAAVYEKHANIIINREHATSKEIRQLADKLKEKVKQKFGIELDEEVICLGDF